MRDVCKATALVGMVVVLLFTLVLCGCGGGEKGTNTVILGWLGDQTGASSGAFNEVMMGMKDYLAEMEATNPILGVNIKIIPYDTRLEYGRLAVGYQWLVGQGTDLVLGYLPNTSAVLQADLAEDKIPIYSFVAYPTTMDAQWVYSYMYTSELEGRAMMDYLVNVWWPSKNKGRPLKVANVGNPGWDVTAQYRKGFNTALAENPGKAVYIEVGGDVAQTAWASEVFAVKDCDAILLTTSGTSTGTFLKEAALRGYTGQIVASSNSVLGIWSLVTSLVPKSNLDGMLIPHFYPLWSDDTSYVDYLDEMLAKYRPSEVAKLKEGTTWLSGWLTACMAAEAVRDAADKVGAKNVDGSAMNDALLALNMKIEGMPDITLANSGTHHVFQPYFRLIKYNAAQDEWTTASDWFLSSSFTMT